MTEEQADEPAGALETTAPDPVANSLPSTAAVGSPSVVHSPTPVRMSTEEPVPTPLQVARTTPYNRVPFQPDADLAARVAQRTTGVGGRIGVAIKDLASGRGVLIDPDGEYEAASLFKLAVMYEVYKQRDQGALSLSETLTLTERHVAYDLGTLDRPAGSSIQLDEALERMITISDNSAAILLTDRVNAFTINQDLRALGMLHTRLVLDDLKTSPADMLLFHEMLALGRGPSLEASAEMVHLLSRQRVNDRIPRLLPDQAIVAHKTGNLPGVVNDVGIVYGPRATFVIAVLVDGTRDDLAAARLTADLAAIAYDYFDKLPSEMEIARFPAPLPTSTLRPAPRLAPPTATVPPPSHTATAIPPPTATVPASVTPTLVPPSATQTPGEGR